jgi:hypothetical protein
MATRKNEPKPSLIVIMATRISYLLTNKLQNVKISSFVPLHHYTMGENANKSHNLLYLW